jgi:DNA-binding GntR family transcriptional regulator
MKPTSRAQTSEDDRIVPQQLWELVVDRLRQDILDGMLAPGVRLAEPDLAERFGTSRGPIREALRELARLGLAVDRPRVGTFVSTMTETDLEEVFVVREALEVAAARLALEKAGAGELHRLAVALESLEAAYADPSQDRMIALAQDIEFHRAIFELAGNPKLLSVFEDFAAQTLHLFRQNVERYGRAPEPAEPPAVGSHPAIFEAFAAQDAEGLETAIKAHYRYWGDRVFAAAAGYRRATLDTE